MRCNVARYSPRSGLVQQSDEANRLSVERGGCIRAFGTTEDMIVYVVADNPIGDTYYQPDSNKWGVPIPERRCVRSQPVDYFDGEE